MKSLPLATGDVLRHPHPVLRARKLGRRRPVEVTVKGQRFVLFRDAAGRAVAAPAACPHRGALLAKGKVNAAGQLVCAYHGWRVGGDGRAVSASVPGKTCEVPLLATWERHGYIWIARAGVGDQAFPDFLEPGHRLITAFTTRFAAPLPVVLDNFGEVEHAFQIHRFIGSSEDALPTATFTSEQRGQETHGKFTCDYRSLPLSLNRFFGIRAGDRYHNDWVFRFRPLFGCYRNYWTDPVDERRRPVSFIVTSFLVPTVEGQVDVHVFLQIAITGGLPRLLAPIIRWFAAAIVRYEIWADAQIARFAPAAQDSDGQRWQLTSWDKQIFTNRKLMEEIYLGEVPRSERRGA